MPTETRPIRNRQEFFIAYNRWLSGDSQGQIFHRFQYSPEYKSVGLRTVTTWLRWFREVPEEEKEKDRPFHFHNMENYGIPWSAYEDTLGLVKRLSLVLNVEPSVRQAKWIWRLRQIGTLRREIDETRSSTHPVIQLANRYVTHEWERLFKLPHTESMESISESVESEVRETAIRSYTSMRGSDES